MKIKTKIRKATSVPLKLSDHFFLLTRDHDHVIKTNQNFVRLRITLHRKMSKNSADWHQFQINFRQMFRHTKNYVETTFCDLFWTFFRVVWPLLTLNDPETNFFGTFSSNASFLHTIYLTSLKLRIRPLFEIFDLWWPWVTFQPIFSFLKIWLQFLERYT